MKKKLFSKIYLPAFANEVADLVPELWAQETLTLLHEKMVMANLVYKEFKDEVKDFGDVVNADRPQKFTARRKADTSDVTTQDAKSTSIPVKLNQHIHTSFFITDRQKSLAMKDLVRYFLDPAAVSLASKVDRALMGVVPQVMHTNYYGRLGGMTSANTTTYLTQTRKLAEQLYWPGQNRSLVVTPDSEAIMLDTDKFTNANQVGDDGTALREAHVGRKYGFNIFAAQNTPYANLDGASYVEGAINNAAGYAAGDTALTVDGFSAAIVNGSYVTVGGSMYPYRVSSTAGGATPTTITIDRGLKDAVLDNAVVRVYNTLAVDLAAGYSSGFEETIHVDGVDASNTPQVGQILSDAAGNNYLVDFFENLVSTDGDIEPDRPLDAALADNAVLGLGPAGSYNLAFTEEAIALVNRPLELPTDPNVTAAVINDGTLSMRVVISYLPTSQKNLVTIDMLMGVKVLDSNQCIVMYG